MTKQKTMAFLVKKGLLSASDMTLTGSKSVVVFPRKWKLRCRSQTLGKTNVMVTEAEGWNWSRQAKARWWLRRGVVKNVTELCKPNGQHQKSWRASGDCRALEDAAETGS